MRRKENVMIELAEEQRHAVEAGEPVRVFLEGHDVVLLRSDIYRRIQSTLAAERAIIAAGHTRGPVAAPEPLSGNQFPPAPEDIVMLPAERMEEIKELVADDRLRTAWVGTIARTQGKWLRDNLS
jgi:hypothetical protein